MLGADITVKIIHQLCNFRKMDKIPGGVKNVPNICMRYSAAWSKWISTKIFMNYQTSTNMCRNFRLQHFCISCNTNEIVLHAIKQFLQAVQSFVGTNRIHGKKCMISRQNFLNVSNFTEHSRKEFCKFTGPTDVILRCCAIANEEISEQRRFTTQSQDSKQSCQLLSAYKSCW